MRFHVALRVYPGNCVGEGNERLFLSFLLAESAVLLFGVIQVCLAFIFLPHDYLHFFILFFIYQLFSS